MKRACALYLVGFLILFAAYFVFLRSRVETPGQYLLSFFGALSASMVLGSLAGIFDTMRCAAALRREKRGEQLRDGRWEAVSGPINPRGASLVSPFGGAPCVAYEYDAEQTNVTKWRNSSSTETKESSVFGWALTPCAIQSARGQVTLCGWSLLDAFPQVELNGPDARARASDYLRQAPFTEISKREALKLVSMLEESLVDDDGAIRTDCRSSDEPDPLKGRDLKERIVRPGEIVTALGVYSAPKGGFMPPRGKAVRSSLWRKAVSMLVFSVIFFLFFHGMIVAILYQA